MDLILTCNETLNKNNMHPLEVSNSDILEFHDAPDFICSSNSHISINEYEMQPIAIDMDLPNCLIAIKKPLHLEQLSVDLHQDNLEKNGLNFAEISSQHHNDNNQVCDQTLINIVSKNLIEDSEFGASKNLHDSLNIHSINIKDLKFPRKIKSRGRPKAKERKTAVGLSRWKRKCLSYIDKSVAGKISVLLGGILMKKKIEDVTREMQADVGDLELKAGNLPSAFLNDGFTIDILKPYLTNLAWNSLQKSILQQKKLGVWNCPLCTLNTASSESIECESCLEWFHFKCLSISKKPKKEWFCDKCHNILNKS
ncbi:uncharacterized protein LOC124812293 [Hydra vulgaris]|uniref:uncharacterized protein LOC124812293 n=1 Tax=Hydra vulgaris TaxID=6087 RepID=UPI001F5EC776|nr:uncharacterized protein LOC124812293 [Hydra vulgaris]